MAISCSTTARSEHRDLVFLRAKASCPSIARRFETDPTLRDANNKPARFGLPLDCEWQKTSDRVPPDRGLGYLLQIGPTRLRPRCLGWSSPSLRGSLCPSSLALTRPSCTKAVARLNHRRTLLVPHLKYEQGRPSPSLYCCKYIGPRSLLLR